MKRWQRVFPIITTKRGGNAKVIQLGENGLVVENPENPTYICRKNIRSIIKQSHGWKGWGTKGEELALSLYKWDRVASRLFEVWENSKQIVATTVLDSKTENVEEDYSLSSLIEQSVNVIEDNPIIRRNN